jgi:hypothetical protein
LPVIAASGGPAKPKTRFIAVNDLQKAMLMAHGKRYFHNLGNLARLRALRTPPARKKQRR